MSNSTDINLSHNGEIENINSVGRERDSSESLSSCWSEMENVDFEEVYSRLRLDIHETLDEIVEEKMQALHKRIRELEQENALLLESKQANEQTTQSLSTNNSKLKFEILNLQDVVGKLKNGACVTNENKRDSLKVKQANRLIKSKQLNVKAKGPIVNVPEVKPSMNGNGVGKDYPIYGDKPNVIEGIEGSKTTQQQRSNSSLGFHTTEGAGVSDASTMNKHMILGRTGTIRGFQNTVKKKVSTYKQISDSCLLSSHVQKVVESEKENEDRSFPGKLVVYTTSSLQAREAFGDCRLTLELLANQKAKFIERDVFINPGYACELKERVSEDQIYLPLVFLKGSLLGNCSRIIQLDQNGSLRELLREFKMDSLSECVQCGGKRFTLCLWCQGSKKGLLSKFGCLKCSVCNKNGLQPCFECNKED